MTIIPHSPDVCGLALSAKGETLLREIREGVLFSLLTQIAPFGLLTDSEAETLCAGFWRHCEHIVNGEAAGLRAGQDFARQFLINLSVDDEWRCRIAAWEAVTDIACVWSHRPDLTSAAIRETFRPSVFALASARQGIEAGSPWGAARHCAETCREGLAA